MYPDLSYFFHDLLGTPVDNIFSVFKTFGLFLAFAFLGSGYILYLEFKRMEGVGYLTPVKKLIHITDKDFYQGVLVNALFGLFLGLKLPYIVQNFAEFKVDPSGVIFSTKGSFFLGILGALAFGVISYFTTKKEFAARKGTHEVVQYPHQRISDIVVVSAISGVAGARLFSILENLDSFWQDPIGQLFSGSGLTVYGGIFGAILVVSFYTMRMGIPLLRMFDASAPAITIGMLIGRLGCQFSGDGDWGIVNDSPKPDWFILPDWAWSYGYPHNVNRAGIQIPGCEGLHCTELIPGVFPTPIYEVLMMTLIFAILWFFRKRIKVPMILFFMWMIMSGIMRFLIEFIRVNDRYEFLGFSGSQAHYISIGFMVVGILGSLFFWNKYKTDQDFRAKYS